MAELKTKLTDQSVHDFLMEIEDQTKRDDCFALTRLMEEVTHAPAKMWGSAIVGVGDYIYQYHNGKTNDWFMMGFSPRKAAISLYILGCDDQEKPAILSQFGKYKTGKGCIYVKKLSDINMEILRTLCELSYKKLKG